MTLSFLFLFLYLATPTDNVSGTEALTMIVELDAKENNGVLEEIKKDVRSFAQDNALSYSEFGRGDAMELLTKELEELEIIDGLNQESFPDIIVLNTENTSDKKAVNDFATALSFRKGVSSSSMEQASDIQKVSVNKNNSWIYLIVVVVGFMMYMILTRLSWHNKLQLRKREVHSIDIIGGDMRKWSMAIKKSVLFQNLKSIGIALIMSIVIFVLINYEAFPFGSDVLTMLFVSAAALSIIFFLISQWIIHYQIKAIIGS